MSAHLDSQEQHRIPQVYLRQWSFKDRGNADTICVMKLGDPVTHPRHVKKFTAEKNLFDTTLHDTGFERFFDEKCKYVESNYNRVVAGLSQNMYDGQTRVYLSEFISNLFVRQRKTFEFLTSIIEKEFLRSKLLNEISLLEKDSDSFLVKSVYEEMSIDMEHTVDSKVSAVILQAWKHFNKVIQRFNHVILRAPSERAWCTTDNPVVTTNFGKDAWLLGPESELYFSISKEYLVYMFHDGQGDELLQKLPVDFISDVSVEIFDRILNDTFIKSRPDYFIFPYDVSYYNARTDEFQKKFRPIDTKEPHEYRGSVSLIDTHFPPDLSDGNLKKLLQKLSSRVEPVIVWVSTHPEAVKNECIQIVDKMVKEQGGKRVLGWQIWESPYILEAELHAIWETPTGELKDISLKSNGAEYIVFVRDDNLVYQGKQVNNIRINIAGMKLIDDFIEVCNQEFRLLNKGKRAFLYGKELQDSLTSIQSVNLKKVTVLKSVIWYILDAGGNENSMCICKSGRKYKNCHGRDVKTLSRLE